MAVELQPCPPPRLSEARGTRYPLVVEWRYPLQVESPPHQLLVQGSAKGKAAAFHSSSLLSGGGYTWAAGQQCWGSGHSYPTLLTGGRLYAGRSQLTRLEVPPPASNLWSFHSKRSRSLFGSQLFPSNGTWRLRPEGEAGHKTESSIKGKEFTWKRVRKFKPRVLLKTMEFL